MFFNLGWFGSCDSILHKQGRKGPAWANSLFEDNAEYGYGMALGVKQIRSSIEADMKALLEMDVPAASRNQ